MNDQQDVPNPVLEQHQAPTDRLIATKANGVRAFLPESISLIDEDLGDVYRKRLELL